MTVECDRATRFQQFPIDRTQDPHDVVAPRRTPNDPSLVIDRFQELSNHEWNGFDSFHFFLCSEKFTLQVEGFIFDVVFLEREEFEVGFEFGEFEVEVFGCGREGREESCLIVHSGGEGGFLESTSKGRERVSECEEMERDEMRSETREEPARRVAYLFVDLDT